mmetsp:Transcript_26700/g.58138  ORF Transcript_26700/g.58138 Transcript_26700/m.58138 type:complete len:92 (-) Transcript_26700:448-723(-)
MFEVDQNDVTKVLLHKHYGEHCSLLDMRKIAPTWPSQEDPNALSQEQHKHVAAAAIKSAPYFWHHHQSVRRYLKKMELMRADCEAHLPTVV